ncbi:MAG: glutamine--fructose-6-phosphate transaminase (isomerizing) [Candidatus Bipolaricaulia bacterium]
MCGIVGYIGRRRAKEILLEGLRRLEYRGYDSAGLALIEGGKLLIFKRAGKVANLEGQVAELPLNSTIGIGHCLAPDTLIQLADGQVIPIAEMESGMMVLSLDPSSLQFIPQPARVSRHRAPKELLEIRTDSTKITCSPEHRMLTVDTATGEIGYCRAEELKQGDLLLLARGLPHPPHSRSLAFAETYPRRCWQLSAGIAIPIKKPYLLQQLIALGVPRAKVRPFRGQGYLTAAQSQRLLELLAAYPQAEPLRERLQRYLSGQVSFQEVRSIRWVPTPEEFVYDLEVAQTENFIANGLISHNSRWATHGRPTDENAHPHSDCQGRLAVIHNGIIENYLPLKEELQAKGHKFASQTDTEVLAHLFEEHYHGDLEEAVRAGLKRVKGAFAIAVIAEDSEEIVAARVGSPLVIGLGEEENFLASDIPAILPYTREMLFLNDGEMAVLTANGVRLSTFSGEAISREPRRIDWDPVTAQKGGYKHFMLKEIHEQPQAVEDTIRGRYSLDEGEVFLEELALETKKARKIRNIYLLACGTSFYAGLVAKYLWQDWLKLPIGAEIGSEFRYSNSYIDENTLVVAISQSGETADTLAGVRKAKEHGAKVIAIANVVGSSITREADGVVYTHAGPEIGVASTKTFTAQLAALSLLGVYLGRKRGELSSARAREILGSLSSGPRELEAILRKEPEVQALARKFYDKSDFLFLGRDILHPIALEGALKLKEISYIHAEGYAAGEMKHGPIALIDEEMPVVVLVTKNSVYDKVFANIEEVKARKGIVLAFTDEVNRDIARIADQIFEIPYTPAVLTPMLFVIPLQLLAYHIGVLRGTDVDQPRNLAKSVTVE